MGSFGWVWGGGDGPPHAIFTGSQCTVFGTRLLDNGPTALHHVMQSADGTVDPTWAGSVMWGSMASTGEKHHRQYSLVSAAIWGTMIKF